MPRSPLLVVALLLVPAAAAATHPPAEREGDEGEPSEATVRADAPRRASSDYTFDVGALRAVPRTSAADLLSLAPGFFLSQHGGEGKAHQLFLRGFDAVHGQDIELSMGGIPLNEVSNVHGQGYADLNVMIPEVVDHLHVLEGPYDPRQGDFAVAGSARFELGVASRGASVRSTYGMYGYARGLVLVAPRGERRETFLAGELSRSDGWGPNRASSRAAAMAQYARELGGGATLRLLATSYAARFDSAGVVRESDLRAGRQDFFGVYDPSQGGFSARHALLGEIVWRHGRGRTEVSAFGSLRDLRIRENFTGFALDPRGDRYEQTYDAATVGLVARHRQSFRALSRTHAWELGLVVRHDATTQAMRRERFLDGVPYATPVDADVNATDVGLYADAELRPLPRLTLRGGLRADGLAFQVDDRVPRTGSRNPPVPRGRRDAQGFQLGPRATVQYDLAPGLALLAAYGKGFRSPQALSLGNGEQAPFATVHAGELGARWRATAGSVSLVGFATHVDRDLVFEPSLGQNVVNEATAATTRVGVAGAARVVPARGLQVVASGTWARATYDAGGALVPYVPPLVARLDVTFERDVARVGGTPLTLSAGLGATYLGTRPLPYSERAPAVGLLDLGVGARFGFVEVNVTARNLTDARWQNGVFNFASNFAPDAPASLVPARHFTAGMPFNLQASLALHL